MVFDLRPETSVLFFDPRPHRHYERAQYVLWPVLVYRVLAPQVRDRQLNTFQMAVLGFCQAGEAYPESIADWIGIDSDLAVLILNELERKGFVDERGRVAPSGERTLSEERGDDPGFESLAVGYVLQDPWSGRLWPRFLERLNYAEIRHVADSRWPRLVIGSKGKPRVVRPWVKIADGASNPARPKAEEILGAVYHHRQALRMRGQLGPDGGEQDSLDVPLAVPHLDRVSLITAVPQLSLLTTRLYIPAEDALGYEDWHAADPFGLGTSPFLRRLIADQLHRDEGLAGQIDNLIGHLKAKIVESQEYLNEMVRERLQNTIKYAGVHDKLAAMERALEDARAAGGRQDRLDDVLVKAGQALERLFACIWREHPPGNVCETFMTGDLLFREQLLNTVAGQIGYQLPLPPSITRVRQGGVRWTAQTGRGTLGQHAAVALLTARSSQKHPFWVAAAQMPDLFQQLAEIIECRNMGAHDWLETVSMIQVEELVNNVYRVVQVLAS